MRTPKRRIGDAFVFEGDLAIGARAVWRGTTHERCARIIVRAAPDDETALAPPPAPSAGIVTRLATYRKGRVLALVDDDVADINLQDLIKRAHADGGGLPPVGLGLYVARSCAVACRRARVAVDPARIGVDWHGRLWFQHADASAPIGWLARATAGDGAVSALGLGGDELDDEEVSARLDEWRWGGDALQAVGNVAVAVCFGKHPYESVFESFNARPTRASVEEWLAAAEETRTSEARRQLGESDFDDPTSPDALFYALAVGSERCAWEDLVERIDRGLDDEPYTAPDFAHLVQGLFGEEMRRSVDERAERLIGCRSVTLHGERWELVSEHLDE